MNPNIPAALNALTAAGITTRVVAADLNINGRTVVRWAKGTHQPQLANYRTLRGMVERLLAETLAGNTLLDAAQGEHLRVAKEALLTDAERAEQERLLADMRRFLNTGDTDLRYRLAVGLDPVAERCEVAEADLLHLPFAGEPARGGLVGAAT